eukprot:m.241456 g.241456  ORF g.241456 m.241456 type:complete len:276 (-) comp18999_c0_seq6:198-1025(-)
MASSLLRAGLGLTTRLVTSRFVLQPAPTRFMPMAGVFNRGLTTKPKRPLSAYMLFCQDNRGLVKQASPELSTTDVTRTLGQKWRDTPQTTREEYETRAQEAKDEYVDKLQEYQSAVSEYQKPSAPARSGYQIFLREQSFDGMELTATSRNMGEKWRAMTEDEKKVYNEKAKKDVERYNQEWQALLEKLGPETAKNLEAVNKTLDELPTTTRRVFKWCQNVRPKIGRTHGIKKSTKFEDLSPAALQDLEDKAKQFRLTKNRKRRAKYAELQVQFLL